MKINQKVLVFDFDGVILDSNQVKEDCFVDLFEGVCSEDEDRIRAYHRKNLGVPRDKKIAYFLEQILKIKASKSEIVRLTQEFSERSLRVLQSPEYLISDTLSFVVSLSKLGSRFLYIASAASQDDLLMLCEVHRISGYFDGVFGSPETKTSIIRRIKSAHYDQEVLMIGDSFHDRFAASECGIDFLGYNYTGSEVGVESISDFACCDISS